MTVPALVLFFFFHTFPLLQGVFYSFTNWRGYGEWDFVGFSNYLNVFQDMRAWSAYGFTFQFAIVSTILVNIFALLIALGLNAKIKFQKTLRAVYFLPNILSILIVGYIFQFIFTLFLPQIAELFGINVLATNILGSPDYAWIGVVIMLYGRQQPLMSFYT